jgi:predicted nucleic acid-binding protein
VPPSDELNNLITDDRYKTRVALKSIRDADDEMFVEAAINSGADAFGTFNRKDYQPVDKRAIALGIDICRPDELLRKLTWRPSETTRSIFRRP